MSCSPYGDIDAYSFTGQAGERVTLRMDPDGINTHFRGMLELYGPADTMLMSQYDSWTGGWPNYEYGGYQVAFVDYQLPDSGLFKIYVIEYSGSITTR